MPELRIGFAGSPDFAAAILKRLATTPFLPCAVFTQPDRPSGRGKKVKANAVKQLAAELELPVQQPENFKKKPAREAMAACNLDVLVVAAYGLILPQAVLDMPRFGCINVHASMLPRWRGAAPIERAMMAGDATTGVCIMQMEAGLDTGPVFASTELPISEPLDAVALEASLADAGAELLLEVLEQLADSGQLPEPTPQDDALATYADKLTAADRTVDWQQDAAIIARQICALAPRLPVRVEINGTGVQLLSATTREQGIAVDDTPPAGTVVDATKQGIVVQCATNLLQITALKVERGKGKALDPAAAINGFSDLFFSGARFN